ncbi:hypothetical protein CA11_33170 [Gimesia maris]|uniref:hypothetical protein n=1 Tax=Gimesia maris TaxID=122 RepID=UPI001188C24B|nr:hypothetical protein [Gimesia maris]QDU15492.1 hypothetical protein CA11_33170 [Gimesia maris]
MSEKRKLPPGIVGSVDELAAALGYHRRTVQEWKSKPGFPSWSNGQYDLVKVDRWRHGYEFTEDDNAGALLEDMDNRAEALIRDLKHIQPGLVQSLPEDQRDAFSALLEKTIGNVVKDAFDGSSEYFYSEFYRDYEGNPAAAALPEVAKS